MLNGIHQRGRNVNIPKEALVTDFVIWYLNRMFETVAPPEDVAAVLVEPIQGEGGYIVPPKDFFPD